MSTYWSLQCTQDGETSEGINHGDDGLREIVSLWPHIEALAGARWLDVQWSPYGASSAIYFYAEHKDHGVELRNEYGDVAPLVLNGAAG